MSLAQCECNTWQGVCTVVGKVCVNILSLCRLIHTEVDLHQLVWYYLLKNGNEIIYLLVTEQSRAQICVLVFTLSLSNSLILIHAY